MPEKLLPLGLLTLLLALATGPGYAQSPDTSYRGKPVVPFPKQPTPAYPADVSVVTAVNEKALDFFTTTLNVAEPTTISWRFVDYTHSFDKQYQRKGYVLNADVRTPIGIGGKRWAPQLWGTRFYHSLQVIPRFRVRIFQDDKSVGDASLPVRTPSYMPGVKWLISTERLWSQQTNARHYLSFYGYHHSNGQDGGEFVRTAKRDTARINTYNGNFSELIVFEFGFGGLYSRSSSLAESEARKEAPKSAGGQATKHGNAKQATTSNQFWYWAGNFEWHPRSLTNREFLAYNIYGRKRLNLQLGYFRAPAVRSVVYSPSEEKYYATAPFQAVETRRLILNGQYILDGRYNRLLEPAPDLRTVPVAYFSWRRLNVDLAYYQRISYTPYAAFFVQAGYWGSDTYNIYFQNRMLFARAGLAFGFFKFDPALHGK